MQQLTEFLGSSYTAYQAVENAKNLLIENGFTQIFETEDWELVEGTVWKVVLPNSFFGEENPYALTINGDWLDEPNEFEMLDYVYKSGFVELTHCEVFIVPHNND